MSQNLQICVRHGSQASKFYPDAVGWEISQQIWLTILGDPHGPRRILATYATNPDLMVSWEPEPPVKTLSPRPGTTTAFSASVVAASSFPNTRTIDALDAIKETPAAGSEGGSCY